MRTIEIGPKGLELTPPDITGRLDEFQTYERDCCVEANDELLSRDAYIIITASPIRDVFVIGTATADINVKRSTASLARCACLDTP